MAAWLKAAEDLFEVVDRRAKLVVGEKPDEPSSFQSPVSNGQGTQAKRTRSRPKNRLSSSEASMVADAARDQAMSEALQPGTVSNRENTLVPVENNATSPGSSNAQISHEKQHSGDRNGFMSENSASGVIASDDGNNDANHIEGVTVGTTDDSLDSTLNDQLVNENSPDIQEGISSVSIPAEGLDSVHEDAPVASGQNMMLEDRGASVKTEKEGSQSTRGDSLTNVDIQLIEANSKFETHLDRKSQQEQKADTSAEKVQDQLDEAQGLLKTAISTGQSKEARLARVCAGLSSRLQEYKSENAQLEELVIAERELSKSYEFRIQQLQKDLLASKSEVTKVESNMAEALAAKNAEIEALVSSIDALNKQAALSEGNLASLQANMESILRNRELTETRMMQALREELASAERRAEDDRAAHSATKLAAMEREVELEHRAIEASTALARIQRTADERTAKAAELEHKVVLLEAECASLSQELQDMEARARREQRKSPEDSNQVIQAWQEEVERAREGQREAESKLSFFEAEIQKMRVEMAAMKRDAEHYSRQEHMELEKRYRELTDLLYYKQTQLETMASEKSAAEFQLEKEMKRLQEAQVEAERSRVSHRTSSYWEEDTDIKALEPLPLHHRHMVGASIQLQKAAKILDSGAVRATRFLWRYPTARLLLLFYLVFVHLFLMYLLHRLQEQADTFTSREVAESMGLGNQTLP